MYSEIIAKVKTKEEAEGLAAEIETLKLSLYEGRGELFEDTLKSSVRAWAAQLVRTEMETQVDKERYLAGLIEKLASLKTLKLYLAFEPTQAAIEKFYSFINQKVGEEVLLEILYQPKILGGAIIIFAGEYRDFSLRRIFEEEFKNMGGEILKILAH